MNLPSAAVFLLLANILVLVIADSEEQAPFDCPIENQLCGLEKDWNGKRVCFNEKGPYIAKMVFCNAMYCEPEPFRHNYLNSKGQEVQHNNSWSRVRFNEGSHLQDECLYDNQGTLRPAIRSCNLLNKRAKWQFIRDWSYLCENDLSVKKQTDCPLDKQLCSTEAFNDMVACDDGEGPYLPNMVYCNARHCEPEAFTHDYLIHKNKNMIHKNSWKRTRFGEAGSLHDLCVSQSGLPIVRQCKVVNRRAQWSSIDHLAPVVCLRRFKEQAFSDDLNRLHDDILEGRQRTNSTKDCRRMTGQMRGIFKQRNKRLLPADIHITGQVFSELLRQPKDAAIAGNLLGISQQIMSSDAHVLRLSARMNATNSLLLKFEEYMDELTELLVPKESCGKRLIHAASEFVDIEVESVSFAHLGVHALMSNKVSVFFVNPMCDNITGIAIYDAAAPDRKPAKGEFWFRFLHSAESLTKLKEESNLEAAVFMPAELWNKLRQHGEHLIFKIYAHDGLFVETTLQHTRKPRSRVLSITMPGLKIKSLPEPLAFLLRNENQRQPDSLAFAQGSGCGYWNYQTWLSDGVTTKSVQDMLQEPIIVCQTTHLTQFAFLIGGSYRSNDLGEDVLVTPLNERVLDIISLVGCCLSLLGVLGIFLTAAIFKSFRSQASTKVLLHLCVAMTLQMVLFVFINTDDVSEQLVARGHHAVCVVLGAALQYSILALFSWMLIIAFLQFQRYVTVIGIERPKHYILKSALVAWSLPLLPTLLVALIAPDSYLPTEEQLETDTGICYPTGYGLIFGLVLPVTLVTFTNLVIFVYVFYSISHSLSQSIQRAERKLVSQQIRLSVLLFFLLGLTWIFGIFAFMQAGIAFSYLFCLTATLQGFVLFVYFVLLDKANRKAWLGLICPSRKKIDMQKRTTELQSMTTSSTNYSRRSQR